MRRAACIISLAALLACACAPKGSLRYPPHRWLADDDRAPIDKKDIRGKETELNAVDSAAYRESEMLMAVAGEVEIGFATVAAAGGQEALNVDNFDEVPDSAWFTNRIGRKGLSPEQIARAAFRAESPPASGPLYLIAGKTEGSIPRLLVRDAKGAKFLLRFEPPEAAGVGIGAQVLSALLLHAAGYNVPAPYPLDLDLSRLALGEGVKTLDRHGKPRDMKEEDLERIKQRISGSRGKRVPALAISMEAGEFTGPFQFRGTRYGDANDRIPHEHRRELRGYRMFCALLNMLSASSVTTADIFVKSRGDLGYVLHTLYDFTSAFGGAGSWVEESGAHVKDKTRKAYDFFTIKTGEPGVPETSMTFEPGYLDAEDFKPGSWKPVFGNEAFAQTTRRDDFWAARIIMRFDDSSIDAMVKAAGFQDARIVKYVAESLKKRRDAIGSNAFLRISPLDDLQLANSGAFTAISFRDLAVAYGFAASDGTEYRFRVQDRFNKTRPGEWTAFRGEKFEIRGESAQRIARGKVSVVRVQARRAGDEWWGPSLDIYVEPGREGLRLLGLQRR